MCSIPRTEEREEKFKLKILKHLYLQFMTSGVEWFDRIVPTGSLWREISSKKLSHCSSFKSRNSKYSVQSTFWSFYVCSSKSWNMSDKIKTHWMTCTKYVCISIWYAYPSIYYAVRIWQENCLKCLKWFSSMNVIHQRIHINLVCEKSEASHRIYTQTLFTCG